jgi:AAA15 family ATPase/GTPase
MRISYSVENIRRLAQVEPIEIRPITVLVGRNSAGKSTFLRSLPLIRQSIETRSSAPILWYGDLVDFGDFKTAISEDEKAGTAVFSFKVDDLHGRSRRTVSHPINYLIWYRTQNLHVQGLEVRYFVGAEGEKPY